MKKKSKKKKSNKSFPVVGIGASAGGLEALGLFFQHVPMNSGMAFVIIQHLPPDYKSMMPEILMKYTKMKVVEVEDGIPIEKNCVYLNCPDKYVAIFNYNIHLMKAEPKDLFAHKRIKMPVDYFFRSLAENHNEKSICIILSGTGTDGTLGIRAIKEVGGLTMVQEEKQAKYDGMSRSAIITGLVDHILPVEKMPGELLKYTSHPYIGGKKTQISEKFDVYLKKIFMLIRVATSHDFTRYRRKTIQRRIQRRMAVHQLTKIEDYVEYLQSNAKELELLFKELLIGVTNFFRDSEAFNLLGEEVLKDLIKNASPDMPIRIWISGCATGEEAYSIAIVFSEAMEQIKAHCNLQIFATDIDAKAIDFARTGIYPESIAMDVSPVRLQRFFIHKNGTYCVKKEIREHVVFAVQNFIKDAPFSKLDMICCRNVLIYISSDLQKEILKLFHYVLNPRGILFLGASESIGNFTDYFETINGKWKIFRQKVITGNKHNTMPVLTSLKGLYKNVGGSSQKELNFRELTEENVLKYYAPACVLVNENYDILYFQKETEKYLTLPTGNASLNILKMAREGLRYKLISALNKARKKKKVVIDKKLHIYYNEEQIHFDLIVQPLTNSNLLLIIFEDKIPYERLLTKNIENNILSEDSRADHIEEELRYTKEHLQSTIKELEVSNEELKSTNEELQSTNEELQSTNEELETSREELYSTNEELMTVNVELKNKVEELSQANSDINNLLVLIEIGTIFLDTDLCIKRFTPTVSKIFNLIFSDVGRPISDINTSLVYEDLYKDAKKVLQTLTHKEQGVQNKEGNYFLMRILPYRTIENMIDGVVITFTDITDKKHAQLEKDQTCEILQNVFEIFKDSLCVINTKDNLIKDCNSNFATEFASSREKIIGQKYYKFFKNKDLYHLALIEKTLKTGENSKIEHLYYDNNERVYLELTTYVVKNNTNSLIYSVKNVTEQKLQSKQQICAGMVEALGVFAIDKEGHIVFANALFLEFSGFKIEEIWGKHRKILNRGQDLNEKVWTEVATKGNYHSMLKFVLKTGEIKEISAQLTVISDKKDIQYVAILQIEK